MSKKGPETVISGHNDEMILTAANETEQLDPRTDAPSAVPAHLKPVDLGRIHVPTPVIL